MKRTDTAGAWMVLVVMPFMYGMECLVAYGSRYGTSVGWHLARPFVIWAAAVGAIGIVLEIKRR